MNMADFIHLQALYTLQSRIEFAGWQQSDIDKYKGPTKEIVSGLAENVREKLGSTYCVCEVCPSQLAIVQCQYSNDREHDRELLLTMSITEWHSRTDRWQHTKSDAVSLDRISMNANCTDITDTSSGYVALAVAHDGGQTTSTELDTGYGTDRQSNMLAFAVHALKLVKDVASNRATKM